MALLTDGNPNGTEDLRVYEAAILEVANVETIDLGSKLGLATEEVSEDVLDILLAHTRASDPQSNIRRMARVSDVAVTPQLKRWHALHALEIVYRDAYNNQLNDRYRAKWDEYRDLARDAKQHAVRFGIGLVLNPIPKAEAPTFTIAAGTAPAALYYVQVSWVAMTGQEGSPSDATTVETPEGSSVSAQAVNPPTNATGWNAYIGTSQTSLALQNSTPIGIGQGFPAPTVLGAGRPPGSGQAPDIYVIGGSMLRRG